MGGRAMADKAHSCSWLVRPGPRHEGERGGSHDAKASRLVSLSMVVVVNSAEILTPQRRYLFEVS